MESLAANRLLGDDLILVHCQVNRESEWRAIVEAGAFGSVHVEAEMRMALSPPTLVEQRQ